MYIDLPNCTQYNIMMCVFKNKTVVIQERQYCLTWNSLYQCLCKSFLRSCRTFGFFLFFISNTIFTDKGKQMSKFANPFEKTEPNVLETCSLIKLFRNMFLISYYKNKHALALFFKKGFHYQIMWVYKNTEARSLGQDLNVFILEYILTKKKFIIYSFHL